MKKYNWGQPPFVLLFVSLTDGTDRPWPGADAGARTHIVIIHLNPKTGSAVRIVGIRRTSPVTQVT